MSYSHLFIPTPITRGCKDKKDRYVYFRNSITYILANDDSLEREYELLRAIAKMVNFNFDDYAISIVHDESIANGLPKTEDEKLNFLKNLAVMILANSDVCHTEDVIIFDAIAHKYGYSLKVLDDVVEHITSMLSSTQQHHIDLKESILSSYSSAKRANKEEFTQAYLAELEDYVAWSNSPF